MVWPRRLERRCGCRSKPVCSGYRKLEKIDPIKRLKDALIKEDVLSEASYSQMDKRVATEIEDAVKGKCPMIRQSPQNVGKNVYYDAASQNE